MKSPVRILITGFGPFPGVSWNASADLVNEIARSFRQPGVELGAAVLPVAWTEAISLSQSAIVEFSPHAVIHFGVAKRCSGFEIETRAFNKSGPKEDRDGVVLGERALHPMSKQFLLSTLSPHILKSALTAANIPAILSKDAGRYLCNAVLHSTLLNAEGNARPLAVFIHIPAFGAEGAVDPRISFREVVTGGEILLRRTVLALRTPGAGDRDARKKRIVPYLAAVRNVSLQKFRKTEPDRAIKEG